MAARIPPPASPRLDPLHSMETYNSQEYFDLVNESRMARRDSDDVADDDNTPEDDGDAFDWLEQVGFHSLVSEPEGAAEDAVLHSLTPQQAAAVRRKVDTYRDTQRRRSKDKGRHVDVRSVFPSEAASADSRSRSATPDSLDSLSPPRSPPGSCSRLDAGSPHSQGYHSSSRGSLDHLERVEEGDRTPEYRHVLRIPVDKVAPGSSPPKAGNATFQQSHDALDRVGAKTKSLFIADATGHYKPSRKSAPPDSSGIEAVSYNPLGSLRRHSERSGLGEVGELHIPRPRTGSKSDPARRRSSDDLYRLGRTFIEYLSEDDVKRIQKLAFIDFTVIFDEHNLSYSRRKARKRRLRTRPSVAESAVFGCALTTLMERDRRRQPDASVPLLLERVLTHLEQRCLHEEGLLRVPGHQQKVDQLRRTVDERFYSRPGDVDEALRTSSANDVAALVKLFLRELPAPLLTRELMDAFHQTDALPLGQQVAALNLLCLKLPETNRAVLRRLLDFLAAVATRETANKMTLENVAMIMAPNLMWPAQRRQKDISVEIEYAAVTSRVVRNMVRHRDGLWEVLPKFIGQVRQQHEAEQQLKAKKDHSRQVKKLLRKKESPVAPKIENEKELHGCKIQIRAPQFDKHWNDVPLKEGTTAGDVVNRYLSPLLLKSELEDRIQGRRGSHRQGNGPTPSGVTACLKSDTGAGSVLSAHFLFEQGGNIGHRRIDHDASLLDCYRANPNAQWEIRCCHGSDLSATVEIVAD
ncbi:rho GTPase-activating protein 18-like isoform X2 [Amphibalanus amphitrite]|uniref:rho GTPase-activating protein 18-like isoform X2 n=1 Tax=Amphibalanus amphitrite TaxID=1232801 RepID=UPI001C911E9B|nr:rho GTPase-activating protein 18-like isoform X2 [Amphibalanus amphitrite]